MRNKNLLSKIFLVLDMLLLIIVLAYAKKNYNYSFIYLLLFIGFLVFYIQLPGNAIRKVIKVDIGTMLSNNILGFVLGMGSIFLQYYLLGVLKLYILVLIIGPIISIFEIIKLNKKRKKYIKSNRGKVFKVRLNFNTVMIFTVMTIIFCLSMLRLQFTYYNLSDLPQIQLGQDYVWHFGNINALSEAFPPTDPRVADTIFKYHYFPDLIYGICKYITKIPSDILMMSLAPILIAYLTVGSLYAFAREFFKSNKKVNIFVVISLLSYTCSYIFIAQNNIKDSMYLDQILTNMNGVAFAVSISLISTIIIKRALNSAKAVSNSYILSSIIVIFVLTGIKGPCAAVLMAGLVATILYMFIFRINKPKKILLFTVLTLIMFFFIYDVLLKSSNGGPGVTISLSSTIGRSIFGTKFLALINNTKAWPVHLLFIGVEFILILSACAIPFLIRIFQVAFKVIKKSTRKAIKKSEIFLIFTSIIGCGGFFLVEQSGFSQVYFIFCIIPFIQLVALKLIINSRNSKVDKVIKILFIIGIVISITYTFRDIIVSTKERIVITINYNKMEKGYSESLEYRYINKNEYEAMLWIKENTNKDDIFISNRQSLEQAGINEEKAKNRFFYYSAYSERSFYLEGFAYSRITKDELAHRKNVIEKIYDEDYLEKYQLLKNNNINYVVFSKIETKDFEINESGIEKCYENEDISIYKVQ